jgi:hypothetical protein
MQSSISKYRITKRVGGGSFGDIYLGVGANGEKVRQGRGRSRQRRGGVSPPWAGVVVGSPRLASKGERAEPPLSCRKCIVEKFGHGQESSIMHPGPYWFDGSTAASGGKFPMGCWAYRIVRTKSLVGGLVVRRVRWLQRRSGLLVPQVGLRTRFDSATSSATFNRSYFRRRF